MDRIGRRLPLILAGLVVFAIAAGAIFFLAFPQYIPSRSPEGSAGQLNVDARINILESEESCNEGDTVRIVVGIKEVLIDPKKLAPASLATTSFIVNGHKQSRLNYEADLVSPGGAPTWLDGVIDGCTIEGELQLTSGTAHYIAVKNPINQEMEGHYGVPGPCKKEIVDVDLGTYVGQGVIVQCEGDEIGVITMSP